MTVTVKMGKKYNRKNSEKLRNNHGIRYKFYNNDTHVN